MKLVYPPGATPLNQDELGELIPSINTQSDLNELEKANIRIGLTWAEKNRKLKHELLSYTGLFQLHQKLFCEIWRWAGKQRSSEKNIGVAPAQIAPEVHKLCEDTKFWIEHKTYAWDEIGARFHHRLVLIHPFVNGNGRHARIATDLLLQFSGERPFTWGVGDLVSEGDLRERYIRALQAADRGKYSELVAFVQS